ncbi:MAG: alkylphosphonate utilization protein [Solirubrobacterales bacterium]
MSYLPRAEASDTGGQTAKVKGSSSIKRGTKVRNIRLVNGVGDHDIDCKIDGFGPMQLKSSVVKKA